MPITIHLSQFDGPLDLLLHLIGKAKVDIKDIFISEITEQYILSVSTAPDLDMDGASEFVQMAATLLEIKSRALLPKPQIEDPDEEDPAVTLMRRLNEYQAIREITQDMRAFETAATAMFGKLPEEYPLPPPPIELKGLTMGALMEAYARMLKRRAEIPDAPHLRMIRRDEFTIPAMIRKITITLKRGSCAFEELLSTAASREEVVTMFLALLELLRLSRVAAHQESIYGTIRLDWLGDGEQTTLPILDEQQNGMQA